MLPCHLLCLFMDSILTVKTANFKPLMIQSCCVLFLTTDVIIFVFHILGFSRSRSRSRSREPPRRRRWDRQERDGKDDRRHRDSGQREKRCRSRSHSRSLSPRGRAHGAKDRRGRGEGSSWGPEKPSQPMVAKIYDGRVTSIMKYGCFVQLEGEGVL